jgi:hypothetical protein
VLQLLYETGRKRVDDKRIKGEIGPEPECVALVQGKVGGWLDSSNEKR